MNVWTGYTSVRMEMIWEEGGGVVGAFLNRVKKFWFVLNADSFLTGGAKLSFLVGEGGWCLAFIAGLFLHAVFVFSMFFSLPGEA